MSGLPTRTQADGNATIREKRGSWRCRFLRVVETIQRHPLAAFWLTALLISLPLVLNPGYFSHDELQWLAFADRDHWSDLPWQGWCDFRPFQFRPLTFNTWLALSKLVGYQPPLMHAFVVGFGLLNAWLLRACMSGNGIRAMVASSAAVLFLISPSVMQVHGWVGTIGDLYCLLAALLAVRLLQREPGRAIELIGVAVLTVLAMWSKESAIVFPALLLAAWPRRRCSLYLPVVISTGIVLVYLALRWQTILYTPRNDGNYAWSIANIPARLLDYAAFPFLPDLAELHVIRLSRSVLRWIVGLGLCMGLLALVGRASWRVMLVLVVGWIACLGPVLLLAQSASVYAYLASAWAFAVCAWAWQQSDRWPRRLMLAIATVVSLHGVLIGGRIVQIGILQHGVYSAIEPLLPDATEMKPLRLAAENRRDHWALVRMFHQVPSWRRIPLGDRIIVVTSDDEATWLVDSDGRLHAANP